MASTQGAGQPPHNSNDQNKCTPSQTTENHIRDNVVRLLFELLRNVDAKAYSECAARKESPFVTFRIYPKQIIIDCNEDGLTKLDLDAICRLDPKAASFKSILIASMKVHIQSSYFSFEFQHNGDETGSRKMKPVWVAPVEDVPEALTRMTLYLHDQGDEKGLQCLRDTALSQFEQLSGISLLFLKKLQRITVEFYNTDGKLQKSKHFRKEKLDDCRVSIEGISIIEGRQATDSQIYHVAEQPAESLATSVVLAFPLDKDYKPTACNGKKEVFNILPITLTKYNFHIYADFDLESDRKNLVATSKRNLELRELIVDAFHTALDSFWRHPTLCYDWPMFLPSVEKNDEVFWDGLDTAFRKKSNYIVVECRRDSMRTMKDAMFLPESMRDKDDQPLLDDPNNDLFLSSSYSKSAVEALKNHGLKTMGFDALVALLEDDLKREDSKTKAKETSDEWHSQMADLLLSFAKTWPSHMEMLRRLPLVPLENGKWVSFSFGPVLFPTTLRLSIPSCLGMQVMSQAPTKNPARYKLFQSLGSTPAKVEQIRDLIASRLDSPKELSIKDLVSCLRYLFVTHRASDYSQHQYAKVQVMDIVLRRMKPQLETIYMTGIDHPYSPENLLPADKLPALFLHRTISEANTPSTGISAPAWKEWLCKSIGVRQETSLLFGMGNNPFYTLELIYNFCPDKFLGFLKYHWGQEGRQLEKSEALLLHLRHYPASKICVGNFSVKLKDTWLPDRDIEMVVKRYTDDLVHFPFLRIEHDDNFQPVSVEWEFLTKNKLVKRGQNMELFLELIECMRRLCLKDISESQLQKVLDLYGEIGSVLAVSSDESANNTKRALQFFGDSNILYVDDGGPLWTGLSSCLWAAPPDMITSYSLESFFTQRACNSRQVENLRRLFHKRMNIRNATVNDLVTELKQLRNAGCEDVLRIVGIYQYLDEKIDALSELRIAFQDSPLLFQISDGCSTWKKTTDFVWVHDETGTELATSYTKLKSFFVFKLGVKPSVEELLKSPPRNVEEAKEILSVLNDAQDIDSWPETDHIIEKITFPVRYPDGRVLLENLDSSFFIGDHEGLKARLKNKIKLLDLELCEVYRLSSLFWKLSLSVRYLSRKVSESTSMVAIDESQVLLGRRDLRHKAYQITRIAANYSSPRYMNNKSAFYQQLRTMRTIESDQISSTLNFYHGSDFIQSEAVLGTACAHITESGRELTVYVPKNAKAQEICYISRLPKAFAQWLNLSFHTEEQVVKALALVFAAEKAMLGDILDDQGIMKLSFEDEDAIESEVSDGEEEYYDIEEPKKSNGHASDLHDDGKDTRKAAFPQQGVFDFNDLQSALPNLDKADKSLPGKGGLFANDLKSQK